MSKNTTYYSLVKPEDTERYDVNVMNANLDTIDANLKTTNDKFASYLPLNANATSATKATQDGNGNNIVNTYARKDYIPPICIGSQIIYDGASGYGPVDKTALLGAYGISLIEGISYGVDIPAGWHIEYKITFQGTTGGDTQMHIWLNNKDLCSVGTWSSNTFRIIGCSDLMPASDFGKEATLGYSQAGINLYYSITGGNTNWQFWNVTIHAFLVRD
jgi:hypothetical protein